MGRGSYLSTGWGEKITGHQKDTVRLKIYYYLSKFLYKLFDVLTDFAATLTTPTLFLALLFCLSAQ